MSDRPWKRFERETAALIGGRRYPANLGELVDCESERFVAQCKHVARMSLSEIASLAETAAQQGAARSGKIGTVCIRIRRGRGNDSTTVVVMTDHSFRSLLNSVTWKDIAP